MVRPSIAASFACLLAGAAATDNGMAPTPPMGWRSWNSFHLDINDAKMRQMVDALASRSRLVDGKPTSLADLGFGRMGIDDGWQACGTGFQQSFHAKDGTPLVNKSIFPDLKAMVSYGHSKGVKMEWYSINCNCMDTYTIQRYSDKDWSARVYAAEIKLVQDAGFDGVKIDNCGDDQGIGFTMMVDAINKSGRPLLIENSNQGNSGNPRGVPKEPGTECPGNFFRSGGDIGPDFADVMDKLQRTIPYQDLKNPISRPNCWAYPDMLEVGNLPTHTQSKTHFGAWAVVSAPLILGYDLSDEAITDSIWDIISNKEVLDINQAWAGHPGRLLKDGGDYQIWAKQLEDGAQAVLVLNRGGQALDSVALELSELGFSGSIYARDVWQRRDLPAARGTWHSGPLPPYDSAFVRFGGPPDPPSPPTPAPAPTPPTCEAQCAAQGHCCSGRISSYQHPSCAMGCLAAAHTSSVDECQQACRNGDQKCEWSIAGIDMNNCQDCPSGCDASDGVEECFSGCALGYGALLV